jgi:hypothetical protein
VNAARRAWHALAVDHISGYISGNLHEVSPVANSQQKALTTYRRRMKRKGFHRLEVQVRKDDAALVRSVVNALADPEQEAEARALLRERFAVRPAVGLKALLAAAPLEDINLDRSRDLNRELEL